MRERQPLRMQPQPLHAEVGGHRAVQRPLAVGGVAQDGVGDVFQVAADLVAAALEGSASSSATRVVGKRSSVTRGQVMRCRTR